MTTVYLIRAAESEGELYRIAQGHLDSGVTERGRRQIQALEKRFAPVAVDAVYSSDLYQAAATADGVFHTKGLAPQRRENLREIGLGAWEGINWGNIAYGETRQLNYYRTALDKWRVPGAERPEQVQERMLCALEKIAEENEGKTVAVVSHGGAIRLLLARLKGLAMEDVCQLSIGENSAVTILEVKGEGLRLLETNDISHLQDTEYQAHEKNWEILDDLNTDMYFHPLPWLEYGEIMVDAVSCVWEEAGEERLFDKNVLLQDASYLPTTIGFVEHDPAGFLQMGMEPGWITLLCTHPGCRRVGLGVQLIGQAVEAARAMGAEALRIALPKKNPHQAFFEEYGFVLAGESPDGRLVFEKDIRFDPAVA